MDYIIIYDISTKTVLGDRRLREVARVCEQYGVRVQKSVFEARLDATQYERLIGDIQDIIVPGEDSVVIYRLPGGTMPEREVIGRKTGHDFDRPWIL